LPSLPSAADEERKKGQDQEAAAAIKRGGGRGSRGRGNRGGRGRGTSDGGEDVSAVGGWRGCGGRRSSKKEREEPSGSGKQPKDGVGNGEEEEDIFPSSSDVVSGGTV
jgi:hypothetical protein